MSGLLNSESAEEPEFDADHHEILSGLVHSRYKGFGEPLNVVAFRQPDCPSGQMRVKFCAILEIGLTDEVEQTAEKVGVAAEVLLVCKLALTHAECSAAADTVILPSRADDVVPFINSEELAKASGATLIEVGNDHRLADPEPLAAMLNACNGNRREPAVGI